MYEVSSVGGSKVDAAAAIRHTHRPQEAMKHQVMKFLRRSKSLARSPTANGQIKDKDKEKEKDKDKENKTQPKAVHTTTCNGNHVNKDQSKRNGMVVAIVDGLPFVVGAKNKKKVSILSIYQSQRSVVNAYNLAERYISRSMRCDKRVNNFR